MMSEETAKRIAVALERIADWLERGQADAAPAYLMPYERVFVPVGGMFVNGTTLPDAPCGTTGISARPWGCGGGA